MLNILILCQTIHLSIYRQNKPYTYVDNHRATSLMFLLALVLNLILVPSLLINKQRIEGSTSSPPILKGNAINFSRANIISPTNSDSTGVDLNGNFTRIFNGKTLDGWRMSGEGEFLILYDEKAIQSQGGLGVLWYSQQKYGDFILKLEWRVASEGDNSGVFIRIPSLDDDHNVAVRGGYEVQINNRGEDSLHQTGAIAGFAAPRNVLLKPAGQWNMMEIHVMNQSYKVFINKVKVIEFTGKRSIEGYLGLQAHDDKSRVSYRNITVSIIK
jgi:hypothetical protein